MTLTRQRHDGTSHSPYIPHDFPLRCSEIAGATPVASSPFHFPTSASRRKLLIQRAASGVLGASLCALTVFPALARPRKIVGVPGWTNGSQTYLRSRPGEQTPAVAKVPRHTKVYVWGTFDGWYRVETPDHVFGWVHNRLLNAPNAEKLIELSHRKAILASDRMAHQKAYGAIENATYKTASSAKSSTRSVVAPSRKAPVAQLTALSTKSEKRAPAQTLAEKTAEVRALEWKTAQAKAELVRAQKAAAQAEYLRAQQKNSQQLSAAQAIARDKAIKLEQQRIAKAQADAKLAEAAHQSRWAQQQVERQTRLVQAERERQNRLTAYKTRLVNAKNNEAARRQNRIARWKARENARQNRWTWRQKLKQEKQQRLAMERAQLRKTLGSPVNVASSSTGSSQTSAPEALRPLTPSELMKARNEYLNGQHKTALTSNNSNQTNPTSAADASNTDAPNADTSAQNPFSNDNQSGVQVTPSVSVAPTHSSMLLMFTAKPVVAPVAQPAKSAVQSVTKTVVKTTVKTVVKLSPRVLSYRGGSPMMRLNRGGSPRDYARLPGANGQFGQKMVNQALSYRGMPYIMGAASPNRGFDCSGLIYYMLRQRGYNPPRTAEGLSHYGVAVSRNALQPGDILLFANTYKRGISHAGIYMGNGNFVHAANPSRGVSTNSLSERYYASKFWGARRVR